MPETPSENPLSMPAALASIRDNRVHGSTELLRSALQVLHGCWMGQPEDWARWAAELAAAHPSLAAFRYLADRLNQQRFGSPVHVHADLRWMLRDLEFYRQRMSGELVHRLGPNARIAVHSHSRVLIDLLEDLTTADRLAGIWCGRSLPGGEGAVMAAALAKLPLPVALCEDEQLLASLAEMDALLLGADAFTDEAFLNKVGSLALCERAAEVGAPVHVLAQPFKEIPGDWTPSLGEPPRFEWVPRLGRACHFV